MKQRIFGMLIIVFMLMQSLCLVSSAELPTTNWAAYASANLSGAGNSAAPYLINSAADLAFLAKDVASDTPNDYSGKYIRLEADIDLKDHLWLPIGRENRPFNGNFDGNDKKIKNLTINDEGGEVHGLFGRTGGNIDNVSVVDCNIIGGRYYVGGIAGQSTGILRDCSVTGNVTGRGSVGGLVGLYNGGIIDNCYSTATVSGIESIGGLIGCINVDSTLVLTKSYSTGNVTGIGTAANRAGGFVGYIYSSNPLVCSLALSLCYATGNVSGRNSVGGFVGGNSYDETLQSLGAVLARIQNCYATGAVNGNDGVGGFAGENNGTIGNCYAAGKVTGSINTGGFVGNNTELEDDTTAKKSGIYGYYNSTLNTAASGVNTILGKTDDEFKAQGMADSLNLALTGAYLTWGAAAWVKDITPNINKGYPLLPAQLLKKTKANFEITDLEQRYTGAALEPTITITNGYELKKTTDYIVKYDGNATPLPVDIGSYAVTIELTPSADVNFVLDGQTSATFEIIEKKGRLAPVEQLTEPPKANVNSGMVSKGTEITLSSATGGARVYYTLDGTRPTVNSTLYTTPVIIVKDTYIRAISYAPGMAASQPVDFKYTISDKEKEELIEFEIKEEASKIKFIKGYSDGTFKPDQAITRYEILEALNNLLTFKRDDLGALTDSGLEYSELVILFSGAGIIEGHDDSTFKGSDGLTRAEFVKIMAVMLKLSIESADDDKFPDIIGHWAKDYVNSFVRLGYIKGYDDGTFKPENKLTRAEFTTIVNRIIKNNSQPDENIYSDLTPDHWAYSEILKAYYLVS